MTTNDATVTEAHTDATEFASFKEKFDYKKASNAIDQLQEAARDLKCLTADHYRADRVYEVIYDIISNFHEHMFYFCIDPICDPRHRPRPKGYKSPRGNAQTNEDDPPL